MTLIAQNWIIYLSGGRWFIEFWNNEPLKEPHNISSHPNAKSLGQKHGRMKQYCYGYVAKVDIERDDKYQQLICKMNDGVTIYARYDCLKKQRTKSNGVKQDYVCHKNIDEVFKMLSDKDAGRRVQNPTKPSEWNKTNITDEVSSDTVSSYEVSDTTTEKSTPVVKDLCPGGIPQDGHKCSFKSRKGKRRYTCVPLE